MNKKIISALIVGAMMTGMLTGCGGSSDGSSSKGGKTELELFSSKAENKDILQQLVDKFNKCSKNSPTSLGGEMNCTSEHICWKNPYRTKETLVLHSLM